MKNLFLLLLALFTYTFTFGQCPEGRFINKMFSSVGPKTVQYGENLNGSGALQKLNLDIYEPKDDDALQRPVIVLAFGGSFQAGIRQSPDIIDLCQRFSKKGYVCVSIDYRLSSKKADSLGEAIKIVTNAVHDAKAAVRYLRRSAFEGNPHRIDSTQIFMGGVSAGGFIALHMAYLDKIDEIAFLYDTTGYAATGGMEGNSGNPGYSSEIQGVINLCGALGSKFWMEAGDPFVISCHGDQDGTVPYKTDEITALGDIGMRTDGSFVIDSFARKIGVESHLYTYVGMDHVPFVFTDITQILLNGSIINKPVMDPTEDFITEHLYPHIDCSRLYGTTSITPKIESRTAHIYPNPAGNALYLDLANEPNAVITFTDITGKVWPVPTTYNGTSYQMNMEALPTGVYTLKAQTANSVYTAKAVKQ